MSRSTDTLRDLWAPACQGPFAKVTLYGGGAVVVDPLIVPAVKALDACLRAYGYEATAPDVGAYNCRPITGGTKYSLHAYGIALDINWQQNPYGKRLVTDMPAEMRDAIKAIRTTRGAQVWRWGGDYSGNKDAMHYEVVASPAELAHGIDQATVPGGDDDMPLTDADLEKIGRLIDEKITANTLIQRIHEAAPLARKYAGKAKDIGIATAEKVGVDQSVIDAAKQ